MVKEILGDLMKKYAIMHRFNIDGIEIGLTEDAARSYCNQYGISRNDFSQEDIKVIEEQLAETAAQLKKEKIPSRLVASDLEISLLENESDGVVSILSFVIKESSPNKN